MRRTKIPWCDATWNPVTGCRHGCRYCYARDVARRFSGDVRENLTRAKKYSEGLFVLDEPFRDAAGRHCAYPFGFAPTFHRHHLGDVLRMSGRNVFVGSMCDLFGEWVPEEWITEIFERCLLAPQHNYLFLTKNPNRYVELDEKGLLPEGNNFWFGTTVTKPTVRYFYNDYRNTFLSIEPLLEDFGECGNVNADWVIIGAETGNHSGKVVPEKHWIDGIVRSCDEACVPVFMKDSLLPIVGEDNMRRDLPDSLRIDRTKAAVQGKCMSCGKAALKKDMVTINGKKGREGKSLTIGQMCLECVGEFCKKAGYDIPEDWRVKS